MTIEAPSLTIRIDELLAEYRPDRYEVAGGDDWLDRVAEEVAPLISASEAQFQLARDLVSKREKSATQRTNEVLRGIKAQAQLPGDWDAIKTLPIAFGKGRVALRAVTPQDLRDFAAQERRSAAKEFTVRNETCEAAEWIADQMIATGAASGRELADFFEIEEAS